MLRFNLTRRAFLGSTMLAAATPAFATGDEPYRNRQLSVDERVRDLLSRMTLEEKVAQMRCLWFGKGAIFGDDGAFSSEKAEKGLVDGIGQIARPGDWAGTKFFQSRHYRTIEDSVGLVNAIQKHLVERTRLGIPALFHEEAAHGFAAPGATIFPGPPALASTWDRDLIERIFTVAAREARLRGAIVALAPVLDLALDPRFGRTEEFFSEDAYLTGEIATAAVKGLQGRKRPIGADRVFATLKHFVHGTPEGGLNIGRADISERTLRSTYLTPFKAVIDAANPAILMPSYNEVSGVLAHANVDLLQRLGRGLLGFNGPYFSDYNGITNLQPHHRVAANDDEAAVLAIKAGVDAELPDGRAFKKLPELVRSGRVSESAIDAAASRILALKFEAGLFENPFVDAGRARRATNMPADVLLAREAAHKAIVLLKNDGVLPLDPRRSITLAVIGPNAADALYGGYSGENAKGVGVLEGLKAAAGKSLAVEYAEGVRIAEKGPGRANIAPIVPADGTNNRRLIAEAGALAERSDVVLLVLGDNELVTREAIFEPGDRNTLGLFGEQDALVEAILVTGKPVIALLLNGRPLAVSRLADKANALLEGWYLGQQGGHAIADIIFGKINPSGKLPISLPRSVGDLPVYYNRQPSAELHGYIEGKRKALFPFGFGLSYTSFAISAPRLSKSTIRQNEMVIVEVDVTNTGARKGDEIIQMYISDQISSVPRPLLELRGFERVSLAPGQRQTVRFELLPEALAFWDIEMKWRVEPGAFQIGVGNSSATLQNVTLTVSDV